LIDVLASDVDLKGRNGEPTNSGEGLQGAQHSAVRSIHPTLSVLGLPESHSAFRCDAYRVLRFVKTEREPRNCGSLREDKRCCGRLRPSKLGGELFKGL